MTPDLTYLAYTAALTVVLWIPYIVGLVMATNAAGVSPAAGYTDPTPPPHPTWVKRANRAHLNALENLVPFAVMIVIVHIAGLANETTAFWAMIFFFARVAHAIVYWLGIPYVRTLAFLAGIVSILAIFLEIISGAPT